LIQKKYNHIVEKVDANNCRLRNYALGLFPLLETNSAVKKAINRKELLVNDKVGETGTILKNGDVLTFIPQSLTIATDTRYNLAIVFEDDHLLILNKPPGLLSSGNNRISLQSMLKQHESSSDISDLPFPYLIHRLDRATSGLIIAAKSISARRRFDEMLQNNEIEKEYALICEGVLAESDRFYESMIDNKVAKTEVLSALPLSTKDKTSLVRVKLHTGRTHQIRKHFHEAEHPLVGDAIYNGD